MEVKQDKFQFTPARKLALANAFREHGALIHAYFMRKVQKRDIAENLSQVFWEHVFRKLPESQFDERGLLLFKARQILSNYIEYSDVRSIVEYRRELPDDQFAPDVAYESEEQVQHSFWEKHFPHVDLTEDDRKLFWMRAHDNAKWEDIAVFFGIPAGTVRDRYKRIRLRLLDAYNAEGNL